MTARSKTDKLKLKCYMDIEVNKICSKNCQN